MDEVIDQAHIDDLRRALKMCLSQSELLYGQLAMVIHQDTLDKMKEAAHREIERVLTGV